jgi:hypothetical protein
MCNAGTPIVRQDIKSIKTQALHQRDLIPRHGPFGVIAVIGGACRL